MRYLLLALLLISCKPDCHTVEECKVQEAQEIECRKPVVVSEINGVTLYRSRDGCYGETIYFSTSGTKRTECHSVGKQTVCNDIYVPNTQESNHE